MDEIACFVGDSGCFEVGFLEREATPESAMKLGIRLHLAGLSLSDARRILELVGVDRCRSTIHTWVQKAHLQPTAGAVPDHVSIDETVIQLNDDSFWLCAAVDPTTNCLLHVRLYPTRMQALTEMFLAELRRKHQVDDAIFSLTERRGCKLPVTVTAFDSIMLHIGIGIASNASFGNSNDELTSSQTASVTPKQGPPNNGSKHSPSHGTSLCEHCQ
jgi:hypothetical protein